MPLLGWGLRPLPLLGAGKKGRPAARGRGPDQTKRGNTAAVVLWAQALAGHCGERFPILGGTRCSENFGHAGQSLGRAHTGPRMPVGLMAEKNDRASRWANTGVLVTSMRSRWGPEAGSGR